MTTRLFLLVAASLVLLGGCRSPSGGREAGPGDATSEAARDGAQTPSGAGSGTGGATPSASRDSGGSTGNNPVNAREYAGTPGTTAQKPAPSSPSSGSQCSTDADCSISRFIPGDCCQDCEERPVLRRELEAQNERCAEKLSKCPMRNCAPGSQGQTVSCVAGTCQIGTMRRTDPRQ